MVASMPKEEKKEEKIDELKKEILDLKESMNSIHQSVVDASNNRNS